MQAYLRDAEDDIARLRALAECRGAPFSVRLVKGAYWEEERIVAAQNDGPRRSAKTRPQPTHPTALHRRLARRVAAPAPRLGTHNPRSIAQAVVKAKARGVTSGIEFQMLFGMAEELRTAVVAEGYRTRVYVPVGAVVPGMAYLVRRLLENTSNQSWFIKGEGSESWQALLAAPVPQQAVSAEQMAGFQNAPTIMLHNPAVRDDVAAALATARAGFRQTQPLLLAGRQVARPQAGRVRYPADASVLVGRGTGSALTWT